jgi:regulatory protein
VIVTQAVGSPSRRGFRLLGLKQSKFKLTPYSHLPCFLASLLPCHYASLVHSRTTPRQLSTEQELYTAALRALMRRAHSIHEMRAYLERRSEDKDVVSQVIARLREHNYLDDARYALEFARQRANGRRQGRFRVARELRTRGVPDRHIDAALEAVFADTAETELVRARLKRRLAHLRGPLGQRQIAGIYRSLLRAGFSADTIRAELRGITRGDLPDFPDAADEHET